MTMKKSNNSPSCAQTGSGRKLRVILPRNPGHPFFDPPMSLPWRSISTRSTPNRISLGDEAGLSRVIAILVRALSRSEPCRRLAGLAANGPNRALSTRPVLTAFSLAQMTWHSGLVTAGRRPLCRVGRPVLCQHHRLNHQGLSRRRAGRAARHVNASKMSFIFDLNNLFV